MHLVWPASTASRSRETAFQIKRSLLMPPDASLRLSGEKARTLLGSGGALTLKLPGNVSNDGKASRVLKSQRRTSPSSQAAASKRPSGEIRTEATCFL